MGDRTCAVDGCGRTREVRGLCDLHYRQARRRGELNEPPARRTLEERFWEKVAKSPDADGCWLWTASLNSKGYGQINVNRRPREAYRIAYELSVGAVPDGMELDHLCHTRETTCLGGHCVHRRCVNPDHLEPVTHKENAMRGRSLIVAQATKTHCVNGHEWTTANTRIRKTGTRICRACHRNRENERRRATAAAPAP